MTYTKTPHPHRSGYYIIFKGGRTWSCVDLSDSGSKDAAIIKLMESVGKSYDTLGGRFEAMPLNKDGDAIDGDHQVRAHSFLELFAAVEQYEKNNPRI